MMTPLRFLLALAAFSLAGNASGHVVYKNLLTDNRNSSGEFQGTLTNNYGWIDAADLAPNDTLPLGDTHRVFWARFFVGTTSDVALSVTARTSLEGSTANYLGDLNPAFSLFAGLSPSLGHDGAHPACGAFYGNGCHGVLDVLHDFTMWNSQGQSANLTYLGHALAGNDQTASAVFTNLVPGHYTVVIGGGDPAYAPNGAGMPLGTRAFTVATTISAVPLPASVWFMLGGLTSAIALRRKPQSRR